MPPIHIISWICKDCGFEGEDSSQDTSSNEYEETQQKFNKDISNVTSTINL